MTTRFVATLLRTSASGFAGLAVARTSERVGNGGLGSEFEAWRSHFRDLVLELAAAVDDGSQEQFAERVGWTRDAFVARGLETDVLRLGLEELKGVLKESLPDEAWASLPDFFESAGRELERAPKVEEADAGDELDELATAYIAALQDGEGKKAIDLVVGAIRNGTVTVLDALDGVLTHALREIGRRWHTDEMNVAQEHFASQTTGRLIEQILLQADRSVPNGRTALLTMVEGDAHDLGLRVVAAFFELEGWRTICLGANTPSVDIALAAEGYGADLVVLGATLNTQRHSVTRAIDVLRAARPDQTIIIGGPAFAGCDVSVSVLEAQGCCVDPRDAVRMAHELLGA